MRLRSFASSVDWSEVPWHLAWRRLCSRDGLLLAFEAAIYIAALILIWLCVVDWFRTGSFLSGYTAIVLTLYGHWPLIRKRLHRGDWPG